MNGIYEYGIDRPSKEMAMAAMRDMIIDYACDGLPLIHQRSPLKFRCALLLPGYDCLDVKTFAQLYDERTKFICVENFRQCERDKRHLEFQFKSNFFEKCAEFGLNVSEENVRFHFDDIETLQIMPTLLSLGFRPDECFGAIDFMFLDFCKSINNRQAKWVKDNRAFFASEYDCGFQLYTIPIQPRGDMPERYANLLDEMKSHKVLDYDDTVEPLVVRAMKSNNVNEWILDMARYWNFITGHILNTWTGTPIRPVVYNGGTTESMKMGIFCSTKNDKKFEDYRWEFNIKYHLIGDYDSDRECDDMLEEYNSLGRRLYSDNRSDPVKMNDARIMLILNMPIVDIDKIDKTEMLKYLLETSTSERRFDRDRVEIKVKSMSKWNFPPECDLKGHDKCDALYYIRCQQIFDAALDGKTVEYKGGNYLCSRNGADYSFYRLKDDGTIDYKCMVENSTLKKKDDDMLF